MRNKVLTWLLVVLVTLATALSAMPLDPQYVDINAVLNGGLIQAKRDLSTERCKMAFRADFVELAGAEELYLVDAFEIIRLNLIEQFNVGAVAGAVNCDISPITITVSTRWAGWRGIDRYAKTLIHEFVHTLQCRELFELWGSYAALTYAQADETNPIQQALALDYEKELERKAYRIAGACTQHAVPEWAKRKNKEKQ